MILHVDKEKGRVALGLKQKEENPWDEIEKKYPPGTHVKEESSISFLMEHSSKLNQESKDLSMSLKCLGLKISPIQPRWSIKAMKLKRLFFLFKNKKEKSPSVLSKLKKIHGKISKRNIPLEALLS